MRKLSLIVVALVVLSASAAQAQVFRARDGDVLSVFGGPTSEEWEASVTPASGDDEICTPTGPLHRGELLELYCGPENTSHPEQVWAAKGGVTFRGKFYAHVKQ